MRERAKGATQEVAGAKAGMSRQTAAKYLKAEGLPTDLKGPRSWRTRPDPFEEVWPEVERILKNAPGVQARLIFEVLQREHPGRFPSGQLRTLQRKVKQWRGLYGDDEAFEVFFPQRHRPGEAMQTDFTYTGELNLTLRGVPYAPLLCHSVLPYSGWRSVTLTRSESTLALIKGVQRAVFRIGSVPQWHQTDNSTGATHRVGSGAREFNDDYANAMDHLGMKPRTIAVGKKEQNGSVEAHNGALKRLLEQHLLLRGSRDFEDEATFERWVNDIVEQSNATRGKRIDEDITAMKPLRVEKLKTFKEYRPRVTRNATINIKEKIYSLPPRLMGQVVDVRVYEERIEVYYAKQLIRVRPRLLGQRQHDIDYRHVIWSLVRKPGAMARYHYRDCLFPTLTFRRAYEVLQKIHPGTKGDAEYLRVLYLAASNLESEVEAAVGLLLEAGSVPDVINVRDLLLPSRPELPAMEPQAIHLAEFDALLQGGVR